MFKYTINENINLKLLERGMSGDLFQLVNNNRELLRRWLPWVDHNQSEDDSISFINSSLKGFGEGDGFSCAIYYKNQMAGIIGYNQINNDHLHAKIGYCRRILFGKRYYDA